MALTSYMLGGQDFIYVPLFMTHYTSILQRFVRLNKDFWLDHLPKAITINLPRLETIDQIRDYINGTGDSDVPHTLD